MVPELKQVMNELKNIRKELRFIKAHMADKDQFLDEEERKLLKESYEHEKAGKLISTTQLKKELGL